MTQSASTKPYSDQGEGARECLTFDPISPIEATTTERGRG